MGQLYNTILFILYSMGTLLSMQVIQAQDIPPEHPIWGEPCFGGRGTVYFEAPHVLFGENIHFTIGYANRGKKELVFMSNASSIIYRYLVFDETGHPMPKSVAEQQHELEVYEPALPTTGQPPGPKQ